MRFAAVIMLAAVVGGCALPVPLQVASWVADGISLAATEKSLTDHGLSALSGEDCAMWRAVKDQDICRENGLAELKMDLDVQ